VRPLLESESGNKYILTFQDEWSKFTVATSFPQEDEVTFAKAIALNIVLKLGAPDEILTDQGSNFLRNLC
jgi:hypothetical protein